jgi:hypothetical protein
MFLKNVHFWSIKQQQLNKNNNNNNKDLEELNKLANLFIILFLFYGNMFDY